MSLILRGAGILLLALAAASPLAAQVVRGTVVEAGSGAPVSGALVMLLDAGGRQREGVLTDASGSFSLQAPTEGVYRVRAERVGQRTALSPLLPLAAGSVRQVRLEVDPVPVTLEGIEARAGRRRCDVRPREGAQTAALWEEARKALNVAAWAEEEQAFRYDALQYRRALDASSLQVLSEQRTTTTSVGRHFFTSIPAAELKEKGFVQETSSGTLYYAPDAAVLLSDSFLDDHCFRVEEAGADDRGLVGLAFEPVRGRRLPDIRGVLWLDRRTAELRHLEFRYTNLRHTFATDKLGGRVEFERLPTGAWIVRRWWIRTPAVHVEVTPRTSHDGGLEQHRRETLGGLSEDGGEVTSVANRDGSPVRSLVRAALEGVVFDSTRMAPLPGATVFVSGTSHSAVTDDAGRFRIDGMSEGTYAVSFLHPVLDSLSIFAAPRHARVGTDGVVEVHLAVPAVRVAGRDSRPPPTPVRGADPGDPVPVEGMEARATRRSTGLAEFWRRAETGNGHYVTAEQIERMKPRSTAEVFRSVPSFEVVGTRVRLRMAGSPAPTGLSAVPLNPETGSREPLSGGSPSGEDSPLTRGLNRNAMDVQDQPADCVPSMYLEGVPFEPLAGDLGEIPPDDVEGIEVYARASLAPPQYRSRRTDCGVVLIWLKESVY